MKILLAAVFCYFSLAWVKTSAVLEVSSHVGGEVSIHCSVGWNRDNGSKLDNMYFCRGVCSVENTLIQSKGKRSALTRRGRYSMEVDSGYGVFNVTIKELKRMDTGRYLCGAANRFEVSYQEVDLKVLDASTVLPGSPGSLPNGSFQSAAELSPTVLTLPTTEKTNKRATINLTDTTVVIIISVSLALLVCALIPLVFYGHWRSNAGPSGPEANKGEADYCEDHADGAFTQGMVKLQSLQPDPESSAQDASQYAAVYQALDPKTAD